MRALPTSVGVSVNPPGLEGAHWTPERSAVSRRAVADSLVFWSVTENESKNVPLAAGSSVANPKSNSNRGAALVEGISNGKLNVNNDSLVPVRKTVNGPSFVIPPRTHKASTACRNSALNTSQGVREIRLKVSHRDMMVSPIHLAPGRAVLTKRLKFF